MKSLLLLFIAVPIVEMWLLIEVGARIGALSTIALVFLTAAIGLALLRQQGFSTLLRMNQHLAEGRLPAGEILEGIMLAVGGALLLTPGFLTDAIGFACLIPFTRRLMVAQLLKQHRIVIGYGDIRHSDIHQSETGQPHHPRPDPADSNENTTRRHTIDGEYRREDK